MPLAPPGWYPDPYDPSLQRRWDGAAWTIETTRIAWSPPTAPLVERTPAMRPPSATNWRRLAIVAGAVVLPLVGFMTGYAAHHSDKAAQSRTAFVLRPASTTTTGSEPANVNVPGPTAPPGIDMAGVLAQQNLAMAADIVTTFMHERPGGVITRHDLEALNPNFAFDLPGVPIGGPGIAGGAVVSTAIDQLPHAPRRVVLALPGNTACYYVSVVEGGAKQYGLARGADAVSHCFVTETAGGAPQVRPNTKWTSRWSVPTS